MGLAILMVVLAVVLMAICVGVAMFIASRSWPWEVIRRGYADTFVLIAAWAIPTGACWIAVAATTRLPPDDSFWVALALVCGVGSLAVAWSSVRGQRRAGGVLIDLGEVRGRNMQAVTAVFLMVAFVYEADTVAAKLFCLPFGLLMGLWLWYCRDSHAQVRENGLWTYTTLRPWDAVEYADWVPGGPRDGDVTLLLRLRRRSPFAPNKWAAVPMNLQLQPQVESILRERGVQVGAPALALARAGTET